MIIRIPVPQFLGRWLVGRLMSKAERDQLEENAEAFGTARRQVNLTPGGMFSMSAVLHSETEQVSITPEDGLAHLALATVYTLMEAHKLAVGRLCEIDQEKPSDEYLSRFSDFKEKQGELLTHIAEMKRMEKSE